MGHTVKRVAESDVEEGLFDSPDDVGDAVAASADRHHHGPRRPRQDVAARRDPQRQCRGGRGRRHHPAYRRLSGDRARRREDHLHRHARPRRFHRDARPRREGHRHRRAGGGRRRRRDAADDRGDPPRQGGQRADHRGDQQDRQAGRQSAARDAGTAAARRAGRSVRRRYAGGRGFRAPSTPISTSCSRRSRCRPNCSTSPPIPIAAPKARSSRRGSIAAAVRSRPCWCSAARCRSARSSSPARNGAACAR